MKINAINSITPIIKKNAKKGIAMAAGVAIGLAAYSAYNNTKLNQNNGRGDEIVLSIPNKIEKGHEFNSANSLESQGKTKHWFRAKNGPDKGSKFYRDSDYDFFGNYKG